MDSPALPNLREVFFDGGWAWEPRFRNGYFGDTRVVDKEDFRIFVKILYVEILSFKSFASCIFFLWDVKIWPGKFVSTKQQKKTWW